MAEYVLEVEDLKVYYYTLSGIVKAVDGVSFTIKRGEWLSVVGESGCGKSTLAYALMMLVPPPGRVVSGKIIFEGRNLVEAPRSELRKISGRKIGMVLQDPLTSLDPLRKIGDQMAEILRVHGVQNEEEIRSRIKRVLEEVNLPAYMAERYPHQLSGGQRQRVVIASSILLEPSLVLADEPTTALDVIVQASIMDLLDKLRRQLGLAIMLITHDLALAVERSDKIAVMYAGQLVEQGPTSEIASHPLHPYTKGLLDSVPRLFEEHRVQSIPGYPPDLRSPPPGCRFHPRCPLADDKCRRMEPEERQPLPGRRVLCWKPMLGG